MDNKFKTVTYALDSLWRFGFCSLEKSKQDEINIIVGIIEDCGEYCNVVELSSETVKIFKLKR